MMRHPLSALVLAGVIGIGTLTLSGTAEAGRGRVRFSSGARFSGHWHGRASVRFARPAIRPRVWVGGNVWVGGYYPRPYYYYYYPYYPEAVPSYYGSYYPVQAEPAVAAPGIAAAPAPEPPQRRSLPVFGIGVAGGASETNELGTESRDVSLLARLRLTPGLILEGEFGKTEFKDSGYEDRRIGASLLWEIGAHNTVAPYLLIGGGVRGEYRDDDFTSNLSYGEVGVGLRIALSRNLHLTGDVRAGSTQPIDDDDRFSSDFRTLPADVRFDDEVEYTRARIAAVLYF